jgi:hypothetical protein
MILLDSTTKSLELVTSAAVSTDYLVTYADNTTSAFTPAATDGNISTATTTTVLAAPASSTQRTIKYINVHNNSTTTNQSVYFQYDISGTNRVISPTYTLLPGQSVRYTQEEGFKVYAAGGADLSSNLGLRGPGYSHCRSGSFGLTLDATGNQSLGTSRGTGGGGWAVGSPGVAGRICDGRTSGDAGCVPIKYATTGSQYLTQYNYVSAPTGAVTASRVIDVLWVNSGLSVTTTTAQTINSVPFPPRALDGSSQGQGVEIAIYIVAQTTSANTSVTVSYTNSNGVSGRTATIGNSIPSNWPANFNAGSFLPLYLQAGDSGVRSIESITLGTTLTAGTISVLAYVSTAARAIQNRSSPILNTPQRIYPGACLLSTYISNGSPLGTEFFQFIEEY